MDRKGPKRQMFSWLQVFDSGDLRWQLSKLHRRDSHPLEGQLASLHYVVHFQTTPGLAKSARYLFSITWETLKPIEALVVSQKYPKSEASSKGKATHLSRTWLKKHSEFCKVVSVHPEQKVLAANRPHEHGSEQCITAFLGEKNWSR